MYKDLTRRVIGDTSVIVTDDAAGCVPNELSTVFADGALFIVFDKKLNKLADSVANQLKRAGYRVSMAPCSQNAEAQEFVRFVLAIGAGTAAKEAKRIATEMGIDWSVLLTAPSTDTIMCDFAPKQVFIDTNIMLNCPIECIASGWGIVLSQPVSRFERYFAKKVLARGGEEFACEEADRNMDAVELAIRLLEISADKRGEDGADTLARIVYAQAKSQGKKPRLLGEYKFLSAALLSVFYSSFLGAPSIDAMPPSCRQSVLKSLEDLGVDLPKTSKCIDFFAINSYFRISYILGEYRTDLLDKLSGIDMHTTQRFFRRLYPDAGYWLKGELSQRSLLRALSLAGELDGNLLGFAYASGFTEGFRCA